MRGNNRDSARSARGHRGILPIVGLALVTVVSSVVSLNVALPDIAIETGATQSQLTWIVDAYTVVFASLLFFAGSLGDRFGRKPLLIIGLVIFAAAAFFGTIVTDPTGLIAVRAVMGFGASAVMPTTLSVITTSIPEEQRPRAIGVWVGLAGAGAVLGLFVTAILLEWFPWQAAFWLSVVLAVVAAVAAVFGIPDSREADRSPVDVVGGILALLGVGGLVFGIIEGPEAGWTDPLTLTALGVAAAALIGFVFWELRRPVPMLDPRLFLRRGFAVSSLAITVTFFGWFGLIFMIMQYLQFVLGLTPLQAALWLLPIPFVLIPSARLAPRVAARIGFRPVVVTGMVVLALGLVVLSRIGVDFVPALFVSGVLLAAAGMGMAGTSPTAALTASLPQAKQGVASAMNDTSRELGSAIGIAVLGSALTQVYQQQLAPQITALPGDIQEIVLGSIAFTQSDQIAQFGAAGAQVVADANQAFVAGVGTAFLIGAAVAVVGAIVVLIAGPRRHSVADQSAPVR